MKEIRWFEEIRLTDTDSVGGKGANLGELTAGGLPVPPGFVITGEAYLDAIGRAGIRDRLVAILAEARTASQDDLDRLAGEARDLVHAVPIPKDLASDIVKAYKRLGSGHPGGRAVVGHRRGRRGHLVRRHERDVHQRRRRGAGPGPRRRLLGLAVEGPLHLLPRRQGPDRGAGHRRRRAGDGPLGALGRDVHRRSLHWRDGPHRDRGRLRAGRGGRERPGRARHLRRGEGRAPAPARPGGHAVLRDRARARRRGPAGGARRRRGRRAGCSPTRRSSRWRASAWPPRPTTARRRTRSGPWPAAGPTSCSRGRSPRSGGLAAPGRDGRGGHAARAGPGRLGGPGLRGRARAAVTRPGRAPAGRRGPGGAA